MNVENGMVFEKGMNFNLVGHREMYAITVLELGFKCVITKVQYHDGIVAERKFSTNELSNLLEVY